MRTEKVADHKGHDYSHVSYDVDATHKIVGWAANQNGTDDITKSIAVPEGSTSVNVYAIIKEGYWVTFDSDGGSAIDSQFVFDKISLNDQTTPTKPGYTFVGWYNGTEKVENDATISSPMTLTAHWTPEQVNYTVIHWWENADDDEYSFHESENKTGLTGTEVNAKAKSYEGFTAQPVAKKTVKGDGSTIVSVYYKRNVYDVKFYSYSSWYTSSKEYADLRITAKYGQDISKQWPTKNGSSTWSTKDNGSTYQANINTMPLGGTKFYGPKTGYGTETASYYVQVLPGETGTVKMDGIQYKLDHKDASPSSYYSTTTVTEEDQYPLKGYTFNKGPSTKIGQRYDGAKFYYKRNSYNLKFINNGKEDKSVEKKYEQSISSENYTPTRPSSLPEYYVFDGWYENELCEGEVYDFTGKKMPAQNVTLYAKWKASKVKLTYNLNNPEGTVDKDTKKVEAGTVASTVLPSIPTINEYSFAGWYYADGNGNITSEVFHTGSTITRDTSIVGKWLYKGELRVVYDPGTEKDVTVPTDDRVYAGGARVTVAGNATTTSTSNMKFLGWELNGNVYKPGQSFEVNKDIANKDNQIILTATWGNAETSTTLTYNPGNGIGTATRVDVMNNEAVEIEAHGSLGFSAPVAEGKEYYFAGWADSSTGNATYTDGQTINIDANGENVLYAVWVEKAKITVVAKSDEVTYDGNNHVVDGFNSLTIDGYTVSGLSASVNGTNAGTYNNVITGVATVTKDGKDVTDRVVVTKQNGTLTINKRQVTLTSEGGSKPYDGTALTKPDVAIGGDGFVNGEVSDIKATGSVTNVSDGEVTNTITYTPSEKFNENNYQITKTEGKLSITAVEAEVQVQIVGATDTVGYDGHEHQVEGYEVTINNDKYHEADFTFSGNKVAKGINAGTYNMGLAAEQFKNNSSNFSNVTFTVTDGYLVITPKSINTEDQKITVSDPQGHVYDGNPHQEVLVVRDAELDKTLKSEKDYNVAYSTTDFTNVGEITVTITGIGNYTGKVTRTYEITPKAYTVTTESANKVYDGTALTAGGKIEGIVDGENVEFKVTGSQTNKGTSKNTYSLKWNGSAIETNYALASETIGDLTVTEQTIDPGKDPDNPNPNYSGVTINKPSNKVYDGKEHKWSPAVTDKEGNALVEGTDYEVAYSTSDFRNVTGTITVTITGIGNYTGTVTRTYEITPKAYTVTTESANKVYDGTALTAGGKIEGIVDGENVEFKVTGSQTNKGTSKNTYSLKWNGSAIETNYALASETIGDLTVTEQTIDPGKDPDNPNPNYSGVTINKPSNKVYDGKEHKWSPAVTDKEGNALVEGTDYEVAYSTSDFRNVTGTITVTITGIGNYTGTVTRTYEITPKAYTVTTESAKKVYDGTALTAGGKIEGIVSGETVEFTTTGSRTVEGTSKNTYSLKWNGSAIQTNYKLAKESIGELTVKSKSIIPDEPNTPDDKKTGITVSDPKDSKYDGQEHREVLTVKDTKTGKDLIANKDYTVVYSDDLVNAGTVKVTVTGLGNYSGSFTKTYKITKRLVTLTSATVSKTYDGQALKNTSITVSGDGFVEGEGASYEVTGTQTSVGNSANAFEYKLNEKTLASNYDITKVVGTLTITAAPAPVTPPTSPTPVSPPPVTPRYIQQVVPALTPQEEVKKEKTPKAEPKEEKVEKEKTPKARPEKFWALINLICAIVTVLFGLLLLISKRHKNKDDEDDEAKDQTTTNEDEEKEQEKKRGAFTRVLAVLIAILSVVFFLVTEDMSLRWTWTDQWTIWMVVIGLVQIVVFFVGRKWKNVDDEDEQAQQA